MDRKDFCKYHWDYYLVLEKDFLEMERYISFDLGENNLYDDEEHTDFGNSLTFSNELVKQYQAICSEIDVVMKSICKELVNQTANDMQYGYTPTILNKWSNITEQKVNVKDFVLQPFKNWSESPYKSPNWWTPYNRVKHERILNFKLANLKNVLNALAGLYVLELYLVKFIGDRDNTMDVPNDISKLFEIVNFNTREKVFGKELYFSTDEDIQEILNT